MLAAMIALVCGVGVASADVETMGELREVSPVLKSSPGEVKPLISAENEDYECTAKYSNLQNGAFDWVIGNCPKGSILEAVVRRLHNDKEPEGDYSLGGWIGGNFQGCGWIEEDLFKPKAAKSKPITACAEVAEGKYEVATSKFLGKYNGEKEQVHTTDGYYVVNSVPCPEYANYRPWSTGNVEAEPIRTAPAYAVLGPGEKTPALKWRYTTKYNSTDGTGQYVMVRDARIADGEGNWVFVPRSCLPATLPENEGAVVPNPPSVSTGTASGIQTPNATLNGTVDPNGLSTKYHFEYGTTPSYGVSTGEGSAGSGTSSVPESTAITGLAAGTTYYFRIVATSPTGTSYGNPGSFLTQPPPVVSTNAASSILEEGATLEGAVNPEGLDTHYHFEYGTSSSYGSSTPENDAGSGTSSIVESGSIAGLSPGITYHYRIVATSSAGTSEGTDKTFNAPSAPSVAFDSAGNLWVLAEGPNNSLYVTEKGANGTWYGPYQVGAPGTVYSAPSVAFDSAGNLWVLAEGPNNSLYVTEKGANGTWYGPYQVEAPGTTYSSPSIAFDSAGTLWALAEGPNHSMYLTVRQGSNGSWSGPYQEDGSGTTYSAPSIRFDSAGDLWVLAEGPNNSLYVTEKSVSNGTWYGPYQVEAPGTTYSSPSIAFDSAGTLWALAEGPSNSLYLTVRQGSNGSWSGPYQEAEPGTTY
ncbi:MAG: hypothetical protein WBV85_08390 [Solirubrobacteraceae bacterium]